MRTRNITALYARGADLDGEPTFMLAFLGPEAEAIGRRWSWAEEALGTPAVPAILATPEGASPLVPSSANLVDSTDDEDKDRVLEEARDRVRAVLGGRNLCRFSWRTDASGSLTEIDQTLVDRLGLELRPDPSLSFADQIARFDPASAGRLAASLADTLTWSDLSISCPILGGSVVAPLLLAGSPRFDAGRNRIGFLGFCRLEVNHIRVSDPHRPTMRDGSRTSLSEAEPVPPAEEPLHLAQASPPPSPDDDPDAPPPIDLEPAREPDQFHGLEPVSDSVSGLDPVAISFDRSANVVQLWPAHTPAPGRTLQQTAKSTGLEEAGLGVPQIRDPVSELGDGDVRSTIDAAVARSFERKGGLTSSEQQAFQEIGRALGGGVPRVSPPIQPDDAPLTTSLPPDGSRGIDMDLARHAAAMVEHMSCGLLVIRDKRVLFANEALRENLRFDSHSELLDALALYFARKPPLDLADDGATIRLPTAYGEETDFHATSRSIAWNGAPALLWTVSLGAPALGAPSEMVSGPAVPGSARMPDATAVLDLTGEAIAIVDNLGRVSLLNRQGERFFGRDRSQVLGEDFISLMVSESRGVATALLSQIKSDPDPRAQVRAECLGRSIEGAPIPLDMRIARLDAGHFTVIWRDLSPQRALERDLAQARRRAASVGDQQPDLLASISHQVRTPLNAILGFAEIMMDERFGPLGNPRYKDYLKDMHLSGTQVIAVIDDLMDLSRIEGGRLELRLGAVDINKVIADCVGEAHGLAHRERVIVRTSFGTRLPPILADERSARQIIGNLLSNAIKFNEPGGQVIVSTASADGASVVVRIRDTGIGMSDNDIASALQPFRRLAPTKNTSGTGLGLPLTKALIGANGASLSMRSRPNEGTMVEVTFQVTASAPTRLPA